MNKTELIRNTSKKIGMSQKDTGIVLDALLETMEEGLVEDSRLAITNFATIEIRVRDEYEGRNPSTGKPMTIPQTNVIRMRPSARLKELVNQ